MKRLILLLAPLALAAGCVQPKTEVFSTAQTETLARANLPVTWNRHGEEDKSADDAVKKLLAAELTPDSAVQVALLNNRSLQATYEEIGIAQADLVQAGLLRNPIFSGALKFGEGGAGTKVELGVAENFLDLFAIPLRKKVATAELEATRWRVTDAALSLAARVRSAICEQQAAEATAALRKEMAESTSAGAELAKRLYDAGNINELDLARHEAEAAKAAQSAADAAAEAADAREQLNVLLGLWSDQTNWHVAGALADVPKDEPDYAQAEQEAVKANAALAVSRLKVQAAAEQLHLAKYAYGLDDVQIGVAAERELDHTWEIGPSLAAPIPIFDLGDASKAKAAATFNQARSRYYAAAVELRAATRAARNRLIAARARALAARDTLLPAEHRIVQQMQLHYNGMFASSFELFAASREELEVRIAAMNALRDYWVARTALDSLINGGGEISDKMTLSEAQR